MKLKLQYEELPIDAVVASPTNPRRHFDEKELLELEESVRNYGVMEPLLVRPVDGGKYEIAGGERRWRASKRAGLTTVPVVVGEMDEVLLAEMQMVENIARSNLDPLEESFGVTRLVELGRTKEEIGHALGRGADWVQLRLDLGGLPEVARDALRARRMRLDAAEQMLRLDPDERADAAQTILELGEDLTNAELKEILRVRYLEPRGRREQWRRIAEREMDGRKGVDALDDCERAHEFLRPWGDPVSPWVLATSRIGAAAKRGAEDGMTWGDLAAAHGLRTLLVPKGAVTRGEVVELANEREVREAEAAARAAGEPHTIGQREERGGESGDDGGGVVLDDRAGDESVRVLEFEREVWDCPLTREAEIVDGINGLLDEHGLELVLDESAPGMVVLRVEGGAA